MQTKGTNSKRKDIFRKNSWIGCLCWHASLQEILCKYKQSLLYFSINPFKPKVWDGFKNPGKSIKERHETLYCYELFWNLWKLWSNAKIWTHISKFQQDIDIWKFGENEILSYPGLAYGNQRNSLNFWDRGLIFWI